MIIMPIDYFNPYFLKTGSVFTGNTSQYSRKNIPKSSILKNSKSTDTVQPRDDTLWKELVGDNIFIFINSEQQLHVKSEAHWYKTFAVDTTPIEYRSEAMIQFRLPFIKLPIAKSAILGEDLPKDLILNEKGKQYIKCFFHPSYLNSHDFVERIKKEQLEVEKNSSYLVTPTSSYRTLVMAKVNEDGRKDSSFSPIQIKIGVPGFVLGANRHLWHKEINRSVENAKIPEVKGIEYMKDKTGVVAISQDHIAIPLGFMLRDLPQSDGEYHSFSALFSIEGNNPPLIIDLIENYFRKNPKNNLCDFFKSQIIDPFLKITISRLKHGYTSEPHSQNLGVIIKNKKIVSFFDRDGGGIYASKISNNHVQGFNKLPPRMAEECKKDLEKKSKRFAINVKQQIGLFFTYYTFQKMINLFTQRTYSSKALDLAEDNISKSYNFITMSRDTAPKQSGRSRDNLIKGQNSILETSPKLPLSQPYKLSDQDADGLIFYIKEQYTNRIEEEFGSLSKEDRELLMGPVIEKGNDGETEPAPVKKFQNISISTDTKSNMSEL